MKTLILTLCIFGISLSGFAADPRIAHCVRKDDRAHEYFERYAKLFVYPDSVSPYQFADVNEAANLVRDDFNEIVAKPLQASDSSEQWALYAKNPLSETQRTYSSTEILKLPVGLFKDGTQEFEARFEFRDYDSDYSGFFFWLRGYSLKDRARYACKLAQ